MQSQQNANKLVCEYQLTCSKIYMEKQKTQNTQNNIEGEQT